MPAAGGAGSHPVWPAPAGLRGGLRRAVLDPRPAPVGSPVIRSADRLLRRADDSGTDGAETEIERN